MKPMTVEEALVPAVPMGSTLQVVMGELAKILDEDQFARIEGIVICDGHAAPKPAAPDMADAYAGAREELLEWKRRALEAERKLDHVLAEMNGPVKFGEPVLPAAPAVLDDVIKKIIRVVAELPDRNSPEDWPDAMLVTADELRSILVDALVVDPLLKPVVTIPADLMEMVVRSLRLAGEYDLVALLQSAPQSSNSGGQLSAQADEFRTSAKDEGV